MAHFEHLKVTKIKAEYILSKYPETRDSDGCMVAYFYLNEAGGRDALKNMSGHDFLRILSQDKLTPASSILRVRRSLQNQIPALRGNEYEKRKKKGKELKKDIKNL